MATYIIFGKYSANSAKGISAERLKKASAIVEECGGQLIATYALLGETDMVAIADFPGTIEAMKASVELTRFTEISFRTAPAVTMEEFDKLVGK